MSWNVGFIKWTRRLSTPGRPQSHRACCTKGPTRGMHTAWLFLKHSPIIGYDFGQHRKKKWWNSVDHIENHRSIWLRSPQPMIKKEPPRRNYVLIMKNLASEGPLCFMPKPVSSLPHLLQWNNSQPPEGSHWRNASGIIKQCLSTAQVSTLLRHEWVALISLGRCILIFTMYWLCSIYEYVMSRHVTQCNAM